MSDSTNRSAYARARANAVAQLIAAFPDAWERAYTDCCKAEGVAPRETQEQRRKRVAETREQAAREKAATQLAEIRAKFPDMFVEQQ